MLCLCIKKCFIHSLVACCTNNFMSYNIVFNWINFYNIQNISSGCFKRWELFVLSTYYFIQCSDKNINKNCCSMFLRSLFGNSRAVFSVYRAVYKEHMRGWVLYCIFWLFKSMAFVNRIAAMFSWFYNKTKEFFFMWLDCVGAVSDYPKCGRPLL